MPQMTGGCLCGQVRYTANAEPMFVGVCHCKDCQKETCSAFNIVVAMPQSALSIQGPAATYTQKGDSGQDVVRRLCPNCGSTITSDPGSASSSANEMDSFGRTTILGPLEADGAGARGPLSGQYGHNRAIAIPITIVRRRTSATRTVRCRLAARTPRLSSFGSSGAPAA